MVRASGRGVCSRVRRLCPLSKSVIGGARGLKKKSPSPPVLRADLSSWLLFAQPFRFLTLPVRLLLSREESPVRVEPLAFACRKLAAPLRMMIASPGNRRRHPPLLALRSRCLRSRRSSSLRSLRVSSQEMSFGRAHRRASGSRSPSLPVRSRAMLSNLCSRRRRVAPTLVGPGGRPWRKRSMDLR